VIQPEQQSLTEIHAESSTPDGAGADSYIKHAPCLDHPSRQQRRARNRHPAELPDQRLRTGALDPVLERPGS
jgi:hypothetical protein